MNKAALLLVLFVVLSACGSDGGSTAEPSSADTTTPDTAAPDTTAPAATTTPPTVTTAETPLSAGCEDALDEAEDAVSGVMDILDDAETAADLEAVDPDEISAAFEVLGEVIGSTCTDELGGAVSRLVTFTVDEGDSRSGASSVFAKGFIPELCQIPANLTSRAAEECAAIAGP